jgi:hypothetical protein
MQRLAVTKWIDEFIDQQITWWQNEVACALADGDDPTFARNMLEAWIKADLFGLPENWPETL